jgi:hypothetical protein
VQIDLTKPQVVRLNRKWNGYEMVVIHTPNTGETVVTAGPDMLGILLMTTQWFDDDILTVAAAGEMANAVSYEIVAAAHVEALEMNEDIEMVESYDNCKPDCYWASDWEDGYESDPYIVHETVCPSHWSSNL